MVRALPRRQMYNGVLPYVSALDGQGFVWHSQFPRFWMPTCQPPNAYTQLCLT